MNEIGQVVVHKLFGEGTICSKKDNGEQSYIMVSFSAGEKKFAFPNAFKDFLKAKDDKFKEYIDELIVITDKKNKEKKIKEEQAKNSFENSVLPKEKKATRKITRKSNNVKPSNIAFKCNYCDGGRNKDRIGFRGACSLKLIRNNIFKENRKWCRQNECPCFLFYKGEMTRKELDEACEDGGYVCYESQLLREWTAYAGYHGGEPQPIKTDVSNNLCVLTTREPGVHEKDRFIFAVFLVEEYFRGTDYAEGYVSAHPKYRIELSPKQAKKMLFWKYHCNKNSSDRMFWGSGLVRYLEDYQAAQILRDVARIKKGTNEERLANEFYHYYCKTHDINVDKIGKPNGVLSNRKK